MDRELAEIAGRQHGVVARRQVQGLGLSADTIDRWVQKGRLHRIHPGVYGLGHAAITVRGRWTAAVLASGDGAVLSHRSATALWGIWGSGAGEAHVTVPRKTGSRRSIRRHFGVLPRDEVTIRDGIPVTTAARAVLDRYPRHRGAVIVGRCLERLKDDPGGRVRSTLEESFLPFLDEHRIPRPRLNPWLSVGESKFQVDCYWPDARLIGELDGFRSPPINPRRTA